MKSSRLACNLALFLWGLYAAVFALRLMRYAGIISFNVYLGIDIAPIAWYEDDQEAQIAQWIELWGYVVTTFLTLYLTLWFIISTHKGIATNNVFTCSNVKALMWLSGIMFFHNIFTDNIGIIYGAREVCLNSTPFINSLIVLIVALLYKMAVNVSEENKLTI